MKNFNFLVCYDISCEKRLQKVAKTLEKVSIRIQKSIFFYQNAQKSDIKDLVEQLNKIIDNNKDDIRIYKIDIENSMHFKSAIDLKNPNIIGV